MGILNSPLIEVACLPVFNRHAQGCHGQTLNTILEKKATSGGNVTPQYELYELLTDRECSFKRQPLKLNASSKGCWDKASSTRGKSHAWALQTLSGRGRGQPVSAHRAIIHEDMATGNCSNVHLKCGKRMTTIQQLLSKIQDHHIWAE